MRLNRLIKPEIEQYLRECNFDQDEEIIFKELSKGKSRIEISMKLNISVQCLDKKISNIKSKIKRCNQWNENILQ